MRRSAHPIAKQKTTRSISLRRSSALSTLVALSLIVTVLARCVGNAGTEGAITATSSPVESTRPALRPSPEANAPEDGFTISGTVMDASPSARIIMLEQSDHGIDAIALTDGTVLIATNGAALTLRDIHHGDSVKAHGKAGARGALLADKIVVASR